jgi:hypothetical protein
MLPAVLLLFASLAGEQLVAARQLPTAAGRMLPAVLPLFASLAGEQLVATRQLATAAGPMLPAVILLFASLAGEQLVAARQLATAAGPMLPAVILLFASLAGEQFVAARQLATAAGRKLLASLAGAIKQIYFIASIFVFIPVVQNQWCGAASFVAALTTLAPIPTILSTPKFLKMNYSSHMGRED